MITSSLESLPPRMLTSTELSRALASSPDELAREAAYRLAESADDLDQITDAYADALADIDESLVHIIGGVRDILDCLGSAQSDLFADLDRIRSDLEALSAVVSAKGEAL